MAQSLNDSALLIGDVRVRIDAAPAYDLLFSAHTLVEAKPPERWSAWAARTAGEYSPQRRRKLKRWFGDPYAGGMACVSLIPLLPAPGGAEELLAALRALPVADFMRMVVSSGMTDPDAPLDAATLLALRDDPDAARALVDGYLALAGHQRSHLLRVIAQPEAAREELLALLAEHALLVYAPLEPELREERARAAVRLRERLLREPETLATWLIGHASPQGFSPFALGVSVLLDTRASSYYHEMGRSLFDGRDYEPFILTLGSVRILDDVAPAQPQRRPAPGGDADERLAKAFSALGDPTRLRMLRLLARRPAYGQELAGELGLSGATVSHHVNQLIGAGLVGIERQAHRTYFLVKREAVAALGDRLGALLGEAPARAATPKGDAHGEAPVEPVEGEW